MEKKTYLTPEGLEKLKKELNYLKTVKRKEIAERLKRTASFGDLSENAAFHEAKDAQAFLEGRILELEKIVKNAKVLELKKNGKIQIGSQVQLKNKEDKQIFKFKIVGESETNPLQGKISYESPLGKALLGKLEGDRVKIESPEGKIEYKVLKVE